LIDVGQTGSRVKDSMSSSLNIDVAFTPGSQVVKLVEDVLEAVEHRQANTVMFSLTGLRGLVPNLEPLFEVCQRLTGCQTLAVCDDGLAWSVGSLAGNDGVSLAVGGGVVAVSRKGEDFFHLDGNGSDFGDSGGAFWLGRKGLRAAIRAIEGTGRESLLANAFEKRFGPHDEFVRKYVSQVDIHAVCIEFAPTVLDAAQNKDRVATDIVGEGADRLSQLVVTAASTAGLLSPGVVVALGGGLMTNSLYRHLVEDALESQAPGITVIEPRGDALDGLSHLDRSGRKQIMSLLKWWTV
jgi:glucosamine kinase